MGSQHPSLLVEVGTEPDTPPGGLAASKQRPEGAKGKGLQAVGTAQAKAERQVLRRRPGDKPEGKKEPAVLPLMTSQEP